MENIMLPPELAASLGSESKDFSVKASRVQPIKQSLFSILFGTFWTGVISIFIVVFFGPLLQGKELHFEANGVPTVASPDNLSPVIIPGIIIGIFSLVGIGFLVAGIYSLFKKGGYFVGTPTRLIHFKNGTIRSIDWEQFSGDIEVSGSEQKGDIKFQMRTGKMVSQKNGPDRYVADVIYMSGIPNVFEVERMCRKRIKENDPTPPAKAEVIG